MVNRVTKSEVLTSLLWKFMERGGVQGVQFIVIIVLARLLLPEDFGLIVLVTIFIAIAGVIVQSGFNTALIQRKIVDEIDFSSVFYLNLFFSFILYIILFITAPFIASFFNQPQLIIILRILSFTLFLGSFNSIQNAVIARTMQFKKLFLSSLIASVISGIVGILMAYGGLGVWSLVGHQLTNQLMVTIILWHTVKWRPKLIFSIRRLSNLFSFGWKLLVSSLIDALYSNIRSLLIGKIFSPALLAFYNRGEQFPQLIISNINSSIQSVMLPALSSHQDNTPKVKQMVRRSIVTSSFILFPMMAILAGIAEPLVVILLTEKWLPAVPFLQIFCAIYALIPIHTSNLQAINALGRSDIFLKLEILKKLLGILILIISIQYGVYGMAIGVFVGSFLSMFINAYPSFVLFDYSIKEQWNDILPSFLISIVMGGIVYCVQLLTLSYIVTIFIQIFLGIVIYIGLAKLFKLECFSYLLITLSEMVGSKKTTKLSINNGVK